MTLIYIYDILSTEVIIMSVSNENTRILIKMPKEIKLKLETKAKSENRSLSNYILNLILRDVGSSK